MPVTLAGLGTAAPDRDASQEALAASAIERCCETPAERRLLPNYYRKTTVERRGSVLLSEGNGHTGSELDDAYPARSHTHDRGPGVEQRMRSFLEKAPPLAERAARDALENADYQPQRIDQLVVVTCTGFASPGVEFELIDRLGLRCDIGRTQVGFMGCHGAINGLRVARGLAHAEPGSAVLVVCVELCTLHFQYGWDPQRVLANALFADGAAAAVVRSDPVRANKDQSAQSDIRLLDTAAMRLPDSSADMTWRIEQHGFAMTLSTRVPELIRQHARPWIDRWLQRHGLGVQDVAGWAIHPGGPRVIAATEQALHLTRGSGDPSRRILRDRGNMSSPTVLFVLRELLAADVRGPVVLLAFGPGLVAEAALLDVR